MVNDGPLYRAVYPEGNHLAPSRDTEGAYIGTYLDDSTNILAGQAKFVQVDEDESEDTGDNNDLLKLATVLAAGIAIGVSVTLVVPHAKTWWKETALPALRSVRFSRDKTAEKTYASNVIDEPIGVDPMEFKQEIAITLEDPATVMSSEEAQQRFIMMLLAAAFAAEQFRALDAARIEDNEKLQDLKTVFEELSTESVAELASRVLVSSNLAMPETVREEFSRLFDCRETTDDIWSCEPVRVEQIAAALRLG